MNKRWSWLLGALVWVALPVDVGAAPQQADGPPPASIDEVCRRYPDRVKALFGALALDVPKLRAVRDAWEGNQNVRACQLLLQYYRESDSGAWLRRPLREPSQRVEERAEAVCENRLTFYGQTAVVPLRAEGRLQWEFRGPTNDVEWALALNRHYHLDTLLQAYRETGNPKYVAKIDEQLRDWVTASWPYPAKKNASVLWRGLEVSFRVKAWARVFYELQAHPALSDAARLLVLCSLPDHAHYLRQFHSGGNWATMELSGLALIGAAWPEFESSADWIGYASSQLAEELHRQVYPDGVQMELASHYHLTALVHFEQFAELCRSAKLPLPERFDERLEAMWSYLAFSMRPDGAGVLNNDSNRDFNRPRVLKAAAKYGRDDWRYVAENGRSGRRPEGGPSFAFRWAGQLIMRSGYDREAHWAFFDVGPWGTGHQHNDKLHLSVAAYGRDLLVDSGRFSYSGALARKFRSRYARHSAGHNVILIDGRGQGPGPAYTSKPLDETECRTEAAYDYARGSFDRFARIEGTARHTRAVFYLRGKLWVVIDRIETDRPRTIEALWHWHPHCTVVADALRVRSVDPEAGNLEIVPVGAVPWKVELVEGQESPRLQGWYSEKYNHVVPSPTAVYSATIERSTTFAWVLIPARGLVPRHEVSMVSQTPEQWVVEVVDAEGKRAEIAVPLGER